MNIIKIAEKITKRERSQNRLFVVIIVYILSFLSNSIALEPLLIIRKDGVSFREAVKGLSGELSEDFFIHELILEEITSEQDVSAKIALIKPKIVILMDNKSISLFKKYQSQINNTLQLIPSISLMSVFVEGAISDLKNATGISFEIPIVTSVVNLQLLLKTSIRKVGIVHRAFLSSFLEKNTLSCKEKNIEIASYQIAEDKGKIKTNLKKGLKEILKNQEVDALWIPNDNALLHPSLIQEVWLPTLRRYRIPVIVGARVLVDPKIDLGSFAVLPDFESLGIQTAEIIYSIMDNDWIIESKSIKPPLSVYTIVNLPQVKKYFQINMTNLENVDEQIQ